MGGCVCVHQDIKSREMGANAGSILGEERSYGIKVPSTIYYITSRSADKLLRIDFGKWNG